VVSSPCDGTYSFFRQHPSLLKNKSRLPFCTLLGLQDARHPMSVTCGLSSYFYTMESVPSWFWKYLQIFPRIMQIGSLTLSLCYTPPHWGEQKIECFPGDPYNSYLLCGPLILCQYCHKAKNS
jgi:hypothetical protein